VWIVRQAHALEHAVDTADLDNLLAKALLGPNLNHQKQNAEIKASGQTVLVAAGDNPLLLDPLTSWKRDPLLPLERLHFLASLRVSWWSITDKPYREFNEVHLLVRG
jgi:hypothetical protein